MRIPRLARKCGSAGLSADLPPRSSPRMSLRRLLAITLSLTVLWSGLPPPAAAGLSTGQEVQPNGGAGPFDRSSG